ncbi:hypothetical protein BC833DRAFT_188652 [Globomyces pollinis-pini]|nr:hypothetical protein BC833DRAFT_188652 [Globomyces pollinis-pini]
MFWITSKPYSFPPTNIQNLPIEILYQIAAWCCPKDITQFSMASKLFSPIRNELFAKSKTLIIQNGINLDEIPDLIKNNIQSIKVTKRNFNYTDLKIFKNLIHLYLHSNRIDDVSPLLYLIKLEKLYLCSNRIDDVSQLPSLINLSVLNLYSNNIADISPLKSLVNLKELSLGSNAISDISPVESLINLQKLYIGSNQIVDITALAPLTKLQELSLEENEIDDIYPLASLINLRELFLYQNEIIDVEPLRNLFQLNCRYFSFDIISQPCRTLFGRESNNGYFFIQIFNL